MPPGTDMILRTNKQSGDPEIELVLDGRWRLFVMICEGWEIEPTEVSAEDAREIATKLMFAATQLDALNGRLRRGASSDD